MRHRNEKGPYYSDLFAQWIRNQMRIRTEFKKFQERFGIPKATVYKWAIGDSRPSGKYSAVYEQFWIDSKMQEEAAKSHAG